MPFNCSPAAADNKRTNFWPLHCLHSWRINFLVTADTNDIADNQTWSNNIFSAASTSIPLSAVHNHVPQKCVLLIITNCQRRQHIYIVLQRFNSVLLHNSQISSDFSSLQFFKHLTKKTVSILIKFVEKLQKWKVVIIGKWQWISNKSRVSDKPTSYIKPI